MKRWSKRKIFKTVWVTGGILFMLWNWRTFQAYNVPESTFSSSEKVQVIETEDKIEFKSLGATKETPQVIFFQGGLTDPKAYGPICKAIAENGFTCHLIKMKWRMPQYDYQKIATVLELTEGNWVIGGHSQGGKMAAQFVFENPGVCKGLFLLGTSHPRDIDLSDQSIACIKIYGEKDGLASVEEVLENKAMLPKWTQLVEINGGNHSQFGYLRTLLMDNSASISLDLQQKRTLDPLVQFLSSLNNP